MSRARYLLAVAFLSAAFVGCKTRQPATGSGAKDVSVDTGAQVGIECRFAGLWYCPEKAANGENACSQEDLGGCVPPGICIDKGQWYCPDTPGPEGDFCSPTKLSESCVPPGVTRKAAQGAQTGYGLCPPAGMPSLVWWCPSYGMCSSANVGGCQLQGLQPDVAPSYNGYYGGGLQPDVAPSYNGYNSGGLQPDVAPSQHSGGRYHCARTVRECEESGGKYYFKEPDPCTHGFYCK